jgi:hypothetical protein
MEQATHSLLTGWANFYVIVGSSAAALTGLQFVVLTLINQTQTGASAREIRAFGTPTIVHFCVTLLISAVMSAPWDAVLHVGFCLAGCAVAGLAYSITIIWHARKAAYRPDAEDWIWYTALPTVAYACLLAAAILIRWQPERSMFLIAGTALTFLFVGIHNAWDTVTYVTMKQAERKN